MHLLTSFMYKSFKHDLLNRFYYKKTKNFPKLEKVVLSFGFNTSDLKNLATSLLVLELITKQKAILTVSKHPNILLKIRKGNPIGCKVTLRKKYAFNFLEKFLNEIFPLIKNVSNFSQIYNKNYFSYSLSDISSSQELENKYYLFNYLPRLKITFVINSKFKEELGYILRVLKFPLL